jgi:2-dehydro-3-deoxygluconokinase
LIAALRSAREGGTRITFDTNFRVRGWPDLDVARAVYRAAFDAADMALASTEDLLPLYPGESVDSLMARISSAEVVLKLSEPGSILRFAGILHEVRAEPVTQPVVDTTAAGDSFAAAYIAARLAGADPIAAAEAGHRLAGVVVCHPGAIIPRAAMPANLTSGSATSHKASA